MGPKVLYFTALITSYNRIVRVFYGIGSQILDYIELHLVI